MSKEGRRTKVKCRMEVGVWSFGLRHSFVILLSTFDIILPGCFLTGLCNRTFCRHHKHIFQSWPSTRPECDRHFSAHGLGNAVENVGTQRSIAGEPITQQFDRYAGIAGDGIQRTAALVDRSPHPPANRVFQRGFTQSFRSLDRLGQLRRDCLAIGAKLIECLWRNNLGRWHNRTPFLYRHGGVTSYAVTGITVSSSNIS
jgi:hypothetical protein